MTDYKDEIRSRIGSSLPRPAVDVPKGKYTFDQFADEQNKTAEDGLRLLDINWGPKFTERLVNGTIRYTETIPKTFNQDSFVRSLSKYVGEDPQSVFERFSSRTAPEEDLVNLTIAGSYDDAAGPLDPSESPQFKKIRSDVERANDILSKWRSGEKYYPPFWWSGAGSMLDGAHRAAVLVSKYPNARVDVWVWDGEGEVGL